MLTPNQIALAVSAEAIRLVTGRLLTDGQVNAISHHAVGRYFRDFLPTDHAGRTARERVEHAQEQIENVNTLIEDLRNDLESQTAQLDALIEEIDHKKKQAAHYELLAETNADRFAAFRGEMENTVRQELASRAAEGRRLRQIAALVIWLVTLVAGAALGAYFKEILSWLRGLGA